MPLQRLSRAGASPTAVVSLKGGNLVMTDVSMPTNVEPGQQFSITATVKNMANTVAASGRNPDCCGSFCGMPRADSVLNGYLHYVRASVGSSSDRSDEKCVTPQSAISGNTQQHSLSLTAPTNPGTYQVNLSLNLAVSGTTAATARSLTVGQPTDGGGGGDGGTGGGGGGDGQTPIANLSRRDLALSAGGATAALAVLAVARARQSGSTGRGA